MTELTLTIQYKPLSKKVATYLCLFWALLEFLTIAWFFGHSELHIFAKLAFLLVGAAIVTYPPFVIVSFYREGGTLTANNNGLVLPPSWWGFGTTTSIKWIDVASIDVHTTDSGQQLLLLRTTSGNHIKIDLSSIPRDEAEKLLLAMELWLPNQVWSDRAIAQRDGWQIGAGDTTFTQVWESELGRRYNATTFIPHEPGTKITNDLTIVKQLAFGGFSAVYLAQNSTLENVVIKELVVRTADVDSQAKAVELFQREAQLLAKLQHPQIARVFDHFVKDGNTYMVLEHIDGENLRDFVRRKGAQSESWVLTCALQMATILAYLHGMQPPIVHRDFTPDNLVISSSGKITLIDFGAANEFTTAATGTLVGKQAYMPIEQIRGKAEPRSDLYALGCVLFWLLKGVEPEPLSVCRPRQGNAGISEVMGELVAKLTAQEPGDRFSSANELLAHLQKIAASVEVPSHAG